MPDYLNDSSKQRSRECQLKMYQSAFRRINPAHIQVVCLAGAQDPRNLALEVKHIYDLMGIPHRNITIIEWGKQEAQWLRDADSDWKVEHCSDVEYFGRLNEKKTIISIDSTSQQTEERLQSVYHIAGKELLQSGGILTVNYVAKRESRVLQANMWIRDYIRKDSDRRKPTLERIAAGASPVFYVAEMNRLNQEADTVLTETAEKILNGEMAVDLSSIRDTLSTNVVMAFFTGKYARSYVDDDALSYLPSVRRAVPDFEKILPTLERMKQEWLCSPLGERTLRLAQTYPTLARELSHHLRAGPAPNALIMNLESKLAAHIQDLSFAEWGGVMPMGTATLLSSALVLAETRPGAITEMVRCHYNSSTNYQMMMTSVRVAYPVQIYRDLSDIIYHDESKNRIVFNPLHLSIRDFGRRLDRLKTEGLKYWNHSEFELPPSEDFGSSYVRRQKRSIDKDEIRRLRKTGRTIEDLEAEFVLAVDDDSLAAFRAHDTMRAKREARATLSCGT
jgi:hypothetical protein